MGNLLIQEPTDVAGWHCLIKEALAQGEHALEEVLESYLVFLLMRYTRNTEMARSILTLDYLEAQRSLGEQQRVALQDVGDKCLLYSGLFPGRALCKRVKISYFVELGRSAYQHLSELEKQLHDPLYTALSTQFVSMMDTLQVIREMAGDETITTMQAMQLWNETGSPHAYRLLMRQGALVSQLYGPYNRKH